MNIGVKVLRFLQPSHEDQRMELRKAIACSQAHSENITRTMAETDVQDAIKNLFKPCSCGDD